jgi:hypothetical protein
MIMNKKAHAAVAHLVGQCREVIMKRPGGSGAWMYSGPCTKKSIGNIGLCHQHARDEIERLGAQVADLAAQILWYQDALAYHAQNKKD